MKKVEGAHHKKPEYEQFIEEMAKGGVVLVEHYPGTEQATRKLSEAIDNDIIRSFLNEKS